MNYLGEIISITVAVSWTVTALFAEVGSKRLGSLQLNVIRMLLSLVMLGGTLWWFTGVPYPMFAGAQGWLWLSLSGFVGDLLGDYCLFNSYVIIGSRFGQLFMTLAPPTAAIAGWIILGEKMELQCVAGMLVTLTGIGISVLNDPVVLSVEDLFPVSGNGLFRIFSCLSKPVFCFLQRKQRILFLLFQLCSRISDFVS